jgi:hypothetical protein
MATINEEHAESTVTLGFFRSPALYEIWYRVRVEFPREHLCKFFKMKRSNTCDKALEESMSLLPLLLGDPL